MGLASMKSRELHGPDAEPLNGSTLRLMVESSPAVACKGRLPISHTRFRLPWQWNGKEAILQSRCVDDTGYVQPTLGQLIAVRGLNGPLGSIYHQNAIQSWHVANDGKVSNVHTIKYATGAVASAMVSPPALAADTASTFGFGVPRHRQNPQPFSRHYRMAAGCGSRARSLKAKRCISSNASLATAKTSKVALAID